MFPFFILLIFFFLSACFHALCSWWRRSLSEDQSGGEEVCSRLQSVAILSWGKPFCFLGAERESGGEKWEEKDNEETFVYQKKSRYKKGGKAALSRAFLLCPFSFLSNVPCAVAGTPTALPCSSALDSGSAGCLPLPRPFQGRGWPSFRRRRNIT